MFDNSQLITYIINMSIINKIKLFFNRVRGAFPSPLPQGLTDFNTWTQSIRDTYNPPGDDVSIRFVLSSLLMRLDPAEAYKPKWYFARCLKRAAASQVAVFVQEQIKQEQRATQEEAAKKQAEVTAPVENSGDTSSQISN